MGWCLVVEPPQVYQTHKHYIRYIWGWLRALIPRFSDHHFPWRWRTLVASDPFIDLSLTSISQLALAERHADGFQNLAGGGGERKKNVPKRHGSATYPKKWEEGSGFTMVKSHQYLLFHSAYERINLSIWKICQITDDSNKKSPI